MRPSLVAIALCVLCTSLMSADSHDYKTGTMISWGAGGENCSGLALGKSVTVGTLNCNPGGDTLYKISSEGHEYILTRGADNEGIIHDTSDPLRTLLPKAEFKYRTDKKQKYLWVVWAKDNGKTKETKYTIRGVQ